MHEKAGGTGKFNPTRVPCAVPKRRASSILPLGFFMDGSAPSGRNHPLRFPRHGSHGGEPSKFRLVSDGGFFLSIPS